MAINTALRRASVLQFKSPVRMTLPFPSGSVSTSDRLLLGTAYTGITPSPPPTNTAQQFIYHEQRIGYVLGFD